MTYVVMMTVTLMSRQVMSSRVAVRQTELMVPGVKSPAGEPMMMVGKLVGRGGMKKSRLVR